jgi:argininosuccinate synthase
VVVPAADDAYGVDANIWGRTVTYLGGEGAVTEWSEPPEDLFALTRSSGDAPGTPAFVEIEFDRGTPVKINGVPMPVVELIQSLETIAGAHGVGRIDMVGRDVTGRASRQILEVPAATALHAAHRALQAVATPRDLDRIASEMAGKYVDLVLDGTWFSPARDAIDAFVANAQQGVSGQVRLKLHKGVCQVAGVHPDRSSAARPIGQGPIASRPY